MKETIRSRRKETFEERNARWEAKWSARDKAQAEAKARQAELERRAGCFDDLVAALETILDSLGALCNPSELSGWMSQAESDQVFSALRKAQGVTPKRAAGDL